LIPKSCIGRIGPFLLLGRGEGRGKGIIMGWWKISSPEEGGIEVAVCSFAGFERTIKK